MIREQAPRPSPAKIGVGPEVKKTAENYLSPKLCEIQLLQTLLVTIAKKLLLARYHLEMSLRFDCELKPRSLVDHSYQSSDEDMEIDSIPQVDDTQEVVSDDDEIQVLACYSYNDTFPPQLVAGRAMTTELTECLNDLNIPPCEPLDSISTFSKPSNSLIDWFVGNPPPSYYDQSASDCPIAQCSRLDPVLESPLSPPLIDQRPTFGAPQGTDIPLEVNWTNNPHITGLGISISGTCGQPNEAYYTGCVVCGKDYPAFKEEITLGYLERTHIQGESYESRLAKRNAFEAGMKAGSFILVPRGVSQAAACDGLTYQITPESDMTVPLPGVLPI